MPRPEKPAAIERIDDPFFEDGGTSFSEKLDRAHLSRGSTHAPFALGSRRFALAASRLYDGPPTPVK
jgi:hypothetical protein